MGAAGRAPFLAQGCWGQLRLYNVASVTTSGGLGLGKEV
jgi:hypothetical protein